MAPALFASVDALPFGLLVIHGLLREGFNVNKIRSLYKARVKLR